MDRAICNYIVKVCKSGHNLIFGWSAPPLEWRATLQAAPETFYGRWLIALAIAAAPNPLSILTTETPLAQLFSMASSGVMPAKLAPYPTLVGTAITGASTRPPTTLGKAPSIPATTITTCAAVSRTCSERRR